jgi:DNA mismatch endonuclease (patch repair protein)
MSKDKQLVSRRWHGVDPARSRTMAAVGKKDTSAEMPVRRLLHGLGFRYKLHDPALLGRPDIVLPKWRTAIFVHGCYWHGHDCSHGKRQSRSNVTYWSEKIRRNQDRDTRNVLALREQGWRTLVIWECEVKNQERMKEIIGAHFPRHAR